MKGKIEILDRTGHTTVEYDTEVPESLEVAAEEFRRQRKFGYMAVAVIDGQKQQVREFDPKVTEYTMVPPLAGG